MAPPKRARDTDRNAVVAALTEAYVDGQLDAVEREERTATALAATHVDQLATLLTDLRGDAVDAAAAQLATRPAPRRTPPSSGTSTSSTRRLLTLAVTVALLVGAGVGVRQLFGTDEHDEAVAEQRAQLVSIDDVRLTPEEPDPGDVFADRPTVALEGLDDWAPDEAHVTTLLEQWRAVKRPYVTELRFDENGASITIPVAATTPRTETWTVNDEDPGAPYLWIRDDTLGRGASVIDLTDLDVPRLFDNIGRGIADLNVEDAVLNWVQVGLDPIDKLPQVDIWITNAYAEGARMSTTLSGHVLDEYGFDPDR
ncbi:DUF1707 domain-containing protein [Nocardioides zeae]|uniref:DUF1707 domain-containing protein n=1 Tax=Nocardioides zeae TaxID=1457234 RepID=A0A6P0HHS9_9ACTN|nr:DUF1707 domain-containing protein [Nocardioides zeae]